MTYETITLTRENSVAVLTLNRPDRLNAMNRDMQDEFGRAIKELGEDTDVKALILTGAGRGFCSGADVTGMTTSQNDSHTSEEVLRRIRRPLGWQTVLLYRFPRPTIAAVNGPATGLGLSLAMACDIRIAAQSARFSAIFVRRAIVADNGCTYLLPRIVGMSRALELMYSGDIIDSAEAERIGLVSRVAPDESLMESCMELAKRLAAGPTLIQEMVKRLAYDGLNRTLEDQMLMESQSGDIAAITEDRKEGIHSFLEKREPVFRGR